MRDLLAQSTELQGPRNRQGNTILARNVIAHCTVLDGWLGDICRKHHKQNCQHSGKISFWECDFGTVHVCINDYIILVLGMFQSCELIVK